MRFLKSALLLFRVLFLCLLLIYWVAFVGYSAAKVIEGGAKDLVAYYEYLACEYRLDDCHLNWRAFLFAQGVYLAVTMLLCFLEWRSWRKRRSAEPDQE